MSAALPRREPRSAPELEVVAPEDGATRVRLRFLP